MLSSLLTDKHPSTTRYGLEASQSSTLFSSASTVGSSSTSKDADDDVRRVQAAKFQASGIPTFLAAYHEATRPRARRLVLLCHEGCGGIADRIQGIPYAMGLAVMMRRQFVVHPSLLTNGNFPADILETTVHFFIDGYCSDAATLQKLLSEDDASTVYVKANCDAPLDPSFFLENTSEDENDSNGSNTTSEGGKVSDNEEPLVTVLQKIRTECRVPHLCGAAVIHQVDCFREGLALARHTAEHLLMLPFRNYTALHIRAGGSKINIEGVQTEAVPWSDAHVSTLAQTWIDTFRKQDYTNCKDDLAVISDSTRVVSEIRYSAQDRIMVTNCCRQPLHRDRYVDQQGFFLQEVIDLFILARSSLLIAGNGGFGLLGRYWLGLEGPDFVVAKAANQIPAAFQKLLKNNLCE
jgi:hypothetical protein